MSNLYRFYDWDDHKKGVKRHPPHHAVGNYMECGDYGNLPVVDVDVQHIYLAKLIKQKWIHGNGLITYVETEDFLGGLVLLEENYKHKEDEKDI